MQLRIVGEASNVINTINRTLKATAELSSIYGGEAVQAQKLAIALSGYSTEAIKSAIAQSTLNAEQIKAILTAKGLTDAEIQEVITTNALTASQTGATASTFGLGTAFKGLGLSIKTATKSMIAWMATNPVGWITAVVSAIGASIYGVVKLHDALTVSLQEQKEKLQETKEAYENVKNELQEVETELQNTQNKVEELENTPNLTWVEQEELDRLREVTKELELQKQLKKDAQLESAENLYKENEKTFDKEFKGSYGNTSVSDLKEQLSSGHISIGQLDYKNITDIVTALQYINEEKAKLTDESEIAEYEDFINNLTNLIKSDGQEYLSSLSEYKQNILEIASIRDLTQDEQDFYDYLSSMQKMIYEFYSPATWNNLEFDSIFDTEGIEKTKEELVSMYKSGELSSAEMLEQFPKLNQAIKQSEIIAGESSDVYKEFFNEIAALAEEQADAVNGIMDESKVSLSITETVDQINTQLKPAFDSLKSAYEDIFSLNEDTGEKLFSLDDVDISTFESIRSELEKLGEIDGITIDYSPFERFVSVLSDTSSTAEEVQAQFDNLATSIIYTTDCTNMSAETYDLLVKSLTEMGVTNADEVLANLRDIQEELVSLGYDVADITAEEAAELIRLGAVSAETTEYLKKYLVQKQLAQNPLDTMADITALEALCNALGVTGELYRYVIDLKRAFDAKEMGAVSDGLDSSIEHIKGKIQELASGQVDFKFNFSTPGTAKKSSSKSSSKKDTTKEFDWIEQAIENVEKEVKNLDDVVNSAYSTFSQKNEALAQEIGKVTDEIQLQQQAYDEYMRKAESIGLSDDYKTLIRDGAINIENISDEKLQEKISEYQQWYEKAVDASDAISELSTKVKDLHVKGYELQTDRLEELLDNEAITEKQYISEMTRLYKQYYENQTDYAVQAHKAKMALLDREKSYLNSVANAAASLFDKEINKVQDNAKEQAKVYKAQIKEPRNRKRYIRIR